MRLGWRDRLYVYDENNKLITEPFWNEAMTVLFILITSRSLRWGVALFQRSRCTSTGMVISRPTNESNLAFAPMAFRFTHLC